MARFREAVAVARVDDAQPEPADSPWAAVAALPRVPRLALPAIGAVVPDCGVSLEAPACASGPDAPASSGGASAPARTPLPARAPARGPAA
jgi:hypothetical protein